MRRASLATLILAGLGPQIAAAQDEETPPPSGTILTTTISQDFEADTNFDLDDPSPGTTYLTESRLAMELARISDTRQFGIGIDTGLRALWEAEEDFEFVAASPSSAFLTLVDEGPHLEFDTNLRVRTQRVDSTDIDFEDFGETDEGLDEAEGDTNELRFDADIGVTLAPDAPSSYSLRFIGANIDYADEEETSLSPRRSAEAEAVWTLRLNPVLSSALTGQYEYYSSDDDEETEIRFASLDAGVIYEPNENLTLGTGIGYAHREREELEDGVRGTESDTGVLVRGDIRYDLPDFILFAEAELTTAAPETRTSLALRATYALARGTLTGRVFNRYSGTGTGGDEAQVTGAGIGFVREINTVSRVDLDFAFAHQENLDDPTDPDIDRTTLTASYIRDLTDSVSAELGYGFSNRIEDPENADSHRVFFSIGRTFQTGL